MSVLDEETISALREAGYDPDRYAPAGATTPALAASPDASEPASSFIERADLWAIGHGVQPETDPEPEPGPEEMSLPAEVRSLGYSRRQLDYAVRQRQNPAEQINLYARMNDARRMAEVARGSNVLSEEELEETAGRLNIPPNLAAMLHSEYPDDLEQRKLFARMLTIAGPDSYFARRFSEDPNYAAVLRGHEMEFANLQAATDSVYASSAKIAWGWLKNSTQSMVTESVFGIPAGLFQAARDQIEIPSDAPPEIVIPEGMEESNPIGFRHLQATQALRRLQAGPETAAWREGAAEKLVPLDNWLQETYLDAKADNYAGQTETGDWWLDSVARPVIQGIPSLGSSMTEAAILGPLAPLIHFGLLAQTGSYRDMRAEGVDPNTALAISSARGLFEGYIEKLSVENIFKGPGLRDLFHNLIGPSVTLRSRLARVGGHALKSGLGEGAEEVLQGMAELAATPVAKAISLGDPYSNAFSAIYEGGGDLLEQGWGGFALGVLAGGAFGNTVHELSDMRKYNSFQKAAQPLVAAGDAALKGGKGVAEVRREVRTMAHAAVAHGQNMGTTVYADPADVETYLQGKPREEAEKTLSAIGVTPEAFQQAQADQTDIEIPIENLAVQEGGSDPDLVRLFRPTPNLATASALAQKTREAASVFDLARELRQQIQGDVEGKVVPESIRTLRRDMIDHFNYRAQDADSAASLAWSWGKTQAEKRGIDLDQLLAVTNIRAAMDSWIKRNPAWLAGVRAPAPATQTEETNDATLDASPIFDPAMGEGTLDVPEQPGVELGVLPGTEPGAAAQPVAPGGGGAVGPAVQSPAAQPERTLFSPPPRAANAGEHADRLTGLPFAMETVSTEGIKTDPGAFQFKRDADAETGVKKGQEIPGDVNPAALGTMVLYEDVDGERFVVSGHHRLELLRRKGEEAEVRAAILRENDGWTTDQARAYGAALNIQEGGGDTDDYATFFRESRGKVSREDAEAQGLLRRENAKAGYAIGALGSDNVFYGYLNEELTARQAAAIANAAPGDHAVQDLMIERKIPAAEMETFAGYVKKMQNSGALSLDGVQLSLFAGKDHAAMLGAMEKESKAASREAAELDRKAASLESLLKAGKTLSTAELRKHGARAGDREGLRQEAEALRAEAGRWRNFFHHPDILAQVQDRAGTAPETFSQEAMPSQPKIIQHDVSGKTAPITNVDSEPWRGKGKALRNRAKDILNGYKDLELINADTGWLIGINREGIGKTLAHKRTLAEFHAVEVLPDLIRNSVLTREENNRKANGDDSKYFKLYAPVQIDNGFYAAELTIKEGGDGAKKFYLHRLKLIEPAVANTGGQADAANPPPPAGSQYSISQLLENVNPADGSTETFEQKVGGEKRGAVDLYRADATHRQAAVIRVMKNGDMSTVLHELAHIFLADMRDYVAAGNADIDTVRDYGRLLRAVGDLSVEENVEQVTRWFEEYLREGRAPSMDLVKPFGLFSIWLNRVYPNVRDYVGRDMDPEMRGVFDRWLASEREIAEAEAYYGGLDSSGFLNLLDDDEEKKRLAERLDRTRQRIINRHAGEMARAWSEANTDRERLAGEARRETSARPVYRAIEAARASGIDRAAAERTVGKATVFAIIDAHGDVFAGAAKPIDITDTLRKVGYHEKDPMDLFLKELSEAVPVAEAVRKEGSHGRRKRYYEALEAIARAGGIDPASLPAIDIDTLAGLEQHPGLFRPDARENLDRIAMETGFKTPSDMLEAMAKAPTADSVVERLTGQKVRAKEREARAWAEESLAGVMDDTPPGGQSALHNPAEDILAEDIEVKREALRRAIEARTRRRRLFVERRVLEDGARQELYSKPLREAMDYNNPAKAERHWSDEAADAMARGDREAALDALDLQQKYHVRTTEAFRIRRDFTDFMRRYGQRMAQSELSTVENAYRDAARDILVWSGVVVDKSGRFAPENSDPDRLILPREQLDEFDVSADGEADPSLESFHPSLTTLIPEWIRHKRLPRGYTGNILDLTPAMMADIDVSVKNLIKYGRGELQALNDQDNHRVADLRDKLMAVMDTLPDRRRLRPDKKTLDRIKAGWDNYLFANLSADALAAEMDGFSQHQGKGSGLAALLFDKIRAGEVTQRELLEKFRQATDEDFRVLDNFTTRLKRDNGGAFFNWEGVRSPAELTDGRSADTEWDPEMVLALMFNAGNRGNLYALQQGFGLADAELDTLFSQATEKEWLAVQHVAQEMGSLFDLMDAVHYRMTNRHLERVRPEKITVQTAEGKVLELDGWYYPLVFDPRLNDRAAQNAEAADYRAVMGAIFNPQKLRDGFTHSRRVDEEGNPVVTYPPLLNTSVIVDHMTTATRWLSLAEPLMDFRRVTMDADFREMFIQKFGEERYRDLRMWTNRMARPDKGMDGSWNKIIRKLRNASTVASLGVNLRSAVRQLSSAGLAADEISKAGGNEVNGWHYMWRGLRKMGFRGSVSRLLSPLGFTSEATEEMFRLSPEAKHRAEDVNKDIRDTLDAFRPISGKTARAWSRVRNSLFHFTIATDHLVSGAAWWGAYEQAGNGMAGFEVAFDHDGKLDAESQEKAIRYANRIVRTQQSPYQADYTRLQADNGPISLLTQFMGGLTPYLNSTYVNVQLARRMGWKHATPLATHLMNVYILPSVALTMLAREIWGQLVDDDDEEENALAWTLAEEISGQAVGALPGIRDAVRWGVRRAKTGRDDFGSLLPPSISFPARIGGRLASATENIAEGEAYAAGKDVGMATAEILGVAAPIRQLRPLAEEWGWVDED